MERKFTIFALFYFVFEGKFQVQAPRGGGLYSEGFLLYDFGGLILGGAYTWGRGLIFGILRYFAEIVISIAKLSVTITD